MRVPHFRLAMYSAVLLGAACLFSPFGWGIYDRPLPIVNMLASLGFFVLVTITGIRTMQAWWRAWHFLRAVILLLGVALITTAVFFGSVSLWVQNTTLERQWPFHITAIFVGLGILAGFALQEFVRPEDARQSEQATIGSTSKKYNVMLARYSRRWRRQI